MATAFRQQGLNDRQVVAIIGDGAMTAGLAFEGLNNLATSQANVLVILNDNNMAIDPSVGGLSEYLVDIATSKTYNKLRKEVIRMLGKLKIVGPRSHELVIKVNNSIKTLLTKQTNIFEGLNIRYFGPVDGYDIGHLIQVLSDLKTIPGPKVLHVITKKGKGFKAAEENQTAWHAPSAKFDKNTGAFIEKPSTTEKPPRFQDVFGETILELAQKNKKIIGVTPAMPTGSSLNIMMAAMPERVFDVGIAEQHAVTFSAGLAISGMTPYCNIYSSFMQRAYDQVIHDVALQKLNVIFCLDRSGIVGADGATHHGVYDLAYLRAIPNMTIASPMDEIELRNLMYSAQLPDAGPYAIRYPRGIGSNIEWRQPFEKITSGTGRQLCSGADIAILTIGPIGVKVDRICEEIAAENISAAHYDMRFVKPLDTNMLHQIFKHFKQIITIEDGAIIGGFGTAILEFMSDNGYQAHVKRMGVPDWFVEHGSQTELFREIGLDMESIRQTIREMMKN
jgi:1-deoxy-D-xylulose-5-phosphate synthase